MFSETCPFLMPDFICHFSLPSNFQVLVEFTTTEYASAQKETQVSRHFTNGFRKKNHIYFIFKSIISRILNIVLGEYENNQE